MLQFPLFTPIEMSKLDSGQVMKNKKWSNYFDDFSWPCAFYEVDEYKSLLEQSGLKTQRVESKQIHMSFQGKEGLTGFIRSTLNAITARIPEELRQEFIRDLVDKSVENNPPDSRGSIYLPHMLLEAEASVCRDYLGKSDHRESIPVAAAKMPQKPAITSGCPGDKISAL